VPRDHGWSALGGSNLAVNQIVDELTDKPDIIDDRSFSPRWLVWQTGVDPAVLKRLRLDGNKSLAIGGGVDLCLLVVFPICRTQSMEIDHEGVYGIFTAGRQMHQILPGSGLVVDDNFVADTYGWR
jgi:hypothetical protein